MPGVVPICSTPHIRASDPMVSGPRRERGGRAGGVSGDEGPTVCTPPPPLPQVAPSESTFNMLVDWHLLGRDSATALRIYRKMLHAGFVGNLPL
eukprot:1193550-Prorocentrum_minimum.AAC.2